MINTDVLVFPYNIAEVLHSGMEDIDPETDPQKRIRIYDRMLRESDETQSIGIVPSGWTPINESIEMMGRRQEPTLSRYGFSILGLVRDMDEPRGVATHSHLATLIRHTLYRGGALNYAIHQLNVTFPSVHGPVKEKVARTGVASQGYLNNKVDGKFLFLSTTEFWVETELE